MIGNNRNREEEEEEEEEEKKKLPEEEIPEHDHSVLTGSQDVVDYPPNDYVYRRIDVAFVVFGVATLLADWVFDIIAAYNHYKHRDYMWFAMTVVFMTSSSLVIMGVSFYCYIKDRGKPELAKVSRCKWVVRVVLLLLQLGPLLRYYDTLRFGLLSRRHLRRGGSEDKQKQYYTWMLYEDSDCVFLRMFECFLEAAPQLILQLYILLLASDPVKYSMTWRYLISAGSFTSLVSLAWGVMAFTRSSRFTDLRKDNISIGGSAAIFFWHFFCLVARVTAMVLFASVFRLWLVYVCVGHWLLMAAWLMARRLRSCSSSPLWEMVLSCLMGIIYIFVFLNDKDEPTKRKYVAYYTLWEAENLAMMVMWHLYCDHTKSYYLPAFIIHFFTFFLGIFFMLLYYRFLHPRVSPSYLSSTSTQLQLHGEDNNGREVVVVREVELRLASGS